ncbi:hypothetical protein V6N13_107972 [Hibiscus sabdariffa]
MIGSRYHRHIICGRGRQEEEMWKQKSRVSWVKDRDRNTSFFHTNTMVRRRRNMVRMLEVEDGVWCKDPVVLKEYACHFFESLFTSEISGFRARNMVNNFYQFSSAEMQPLSTEITFVEVQNVVFSVLASHCLSSELPHPATVASFVTSYGDWNWNSIQHLLPIYILLRISTVLPPNMSLGQDTPK